MTDTVHGSSSTIVDSCVSRSCLARRADICLSNGVRCVSHHSRRVQWSAGGMRWKARILMGLRLRMLQVEQQARREEMCGLMQGEVTEERTSGIVWIRKASSCWTGVLWDDH